MTSHMILFRANLAKPAAQPHQPVWNARPSVKTRGSLTAVTPVLTKKTN